MDYQEKDYAAIYQEIFKDENSWSSISEKLNQMQDGPDVDHFRCLFCNELIYAVTSGYIEYSHKSDFKKNVTISLFLEETEKVNLDDYFLFMMRAYFLGQKKEVYKYFNLYLDWLRETTEKESRDEGFFVDFMLEPLKNAYPGFWKYVQKETKDFWKDDSTYQLCGLMSDIYDRSSDEEAVDKITVFIQAFPEVVTARKLVPVERTTP